MNHLSEEIYRLMESYGINKEDMLEELSTVYSNIEEKNWITLNLNIDSLYSLKDTVWYNLEHLTNNGEEVGVSSLKYLGCNFPNLLKFCSKNNFLNKEDIISLLEELKIISNCWSNNWIIAKLYSKYEIDYNSDSKLIIHRLKENPSKYGYCSSYGIVSGSGKEIKRLDESTMLCCIENRIGEFSYSKIVNNSLVSLINCCEECISRDKLLKIDFVQEANYQE